MATITDLFADDPLGTRWTTIYNDGSESYAPSQWTLTTHYAYHTTQLADIVQYARVKLVTLGSDRGEVLLRVPGSGANTCYGVNFGYDGTTGYLVILASTGWVADLTSATFPAVASGDVVAATIEGTGTATRVRCWINPANTTPVDASNWDAASDPPDVTYSAAAGWTQYCDAGRYVGLANQDTSANVYDDFYGGDTTAGGGASIVPLVIHHFKQQGMN
jgi:hypothetical protein